MIVDLAVFSEMLLNSYKCKIAFKKKNTSLGKMDVAEQLI